MPQVYDAVFVGAGHNALACAATLAARGWSVALFERAAVAGGCVATDEVTLPGFRHDLGAMNLSLFAGSPFARAEAGALARHGLDFVQARDCFASSFSDGSWIGVSADLEETAARIARRSARDAAAWRRLVAEFPDRAPTIFQTLGSPVGVRAFASIGLGALTGAGLAGSFDLARMLRDSARGWLTRTFESPAVHAMLGAWGMHLDFAPDVPGGAVFPYLEGMAGQSFGLMIGRGGAGTMIRALGGVVAERGGVIETGAEVTAILTEGGRASGVRLADGREIAARRAVIAGVAPSRLPALVATTAKFDAQLARFRHAPGTMMIHLALDRPLDWRASAELAGFAYVHLADSLDAMQRAYDEAARGLLPAAPVLVVGQPTAVDPSRAPEGRHVLWVQVRMAPGTIAGDAAGSIAARDWDAAAEPFAERALDIIEAHAPGLRARVLGRRVVSPAQLEAWNPNLVGGDQICGSHHLDQNFRNRPVAGASDGATPLAGLWLTGAGVWPGAGTGAGPGRLLAERLTEQGAKP